MDNDDRALLADSLGGIVRERGDRLDEALAEFGWTELLAEEPAAAVSILMEATGTHLAPLGNLDPIALAAAGDEPDPGTAVVYPSLGSAEPTSEVDAKTVIVRGLAGARASAPTRVLVPACAEGQVVLVSASWNDTWPSEGGAVDPGSGLARIEGSLPVDTVTRDDGDETWRRLRAGGHRALAHHLVGVGSRMLELAADHVASRRQFGRTLASFQAVKHRLADVRLWQEAARLATQSAWEEAPGAARENASVLAKSTANRFAQLAREHCQQVLGGMGFTWEHDFHRYARRALLVESLLGTSHRLHAAVGESLRVPDAAPRLAAL